MAGPEAQAAFPFSGYEEESARIKWLDEVQPEYTAWRVHNFGVGHAHQPLLGLIEELGELHAASVRWQDPRATGALGEVRDAIGDVLVYMMDICRLQEWRLSALWATRQQLPALFDMPYQDCWVFLMRSAAHNQLKGEQGIRGGLLVHRARLLDVLRTVLWTLEKFHDQHARITQGEHVLDVLREVWARVSKRDWKANPNTAHQVAEADGP
jgi:hypothetical protein